jgi:Holliday junction resolvase RusA-like endonuclease
MVYGHYQVDWRCNMNIYDIANKYDSIVNKIPLIDRNEAKYDIINEMKKDNVEVTPEVELQIEKEVNEKCNELQGKYEQSIYDNIVKFKQDIMNEIYHVNDDDRKLFDIVFNTSVAGSKSFYEMADRIKLSMKVSSNIMEYILDKERNRDM